MENKFIRSHVRMIQPYEPVIPLDVRAAQSGIPVDRLVKIDANENPYGMPPSAKARLAKLDFGHIYPDPESRLLRKALAEYLETPYENTFLGAGADELIDLIVRLSFNPGEAIINCPPTFRFYSTVSQTHDVQVMHVPRQADFSIDLEGIHEAVADGAKGIFLANPNNPDGSLIPEDTMQALLDLPILIIIDEAYIEFAPESTSIVRQVPKRDNLIVLRTFSKWGGLAGMRLGYGIFPQNYVEELFKIKQPYNVSVAAQQAGLGALEDINLLNQRRTSIVDERNRLISGLKAIPWLQPYPTSANFVLCRVIGQDALFVKKFLAEKGILIRYFDQPRLRDHLRFSIGRPDASDRLITALKEIN